MTQWLLTAVLTLGLCQTYAQSVDIQRGSIPAKVKAAEILKKIELQKPKEVNPAQPKKLFEKDLFDFVKVMRKAQGGVDAGGGDLIRSSFIEIGKLVMEEISQPKWDQFVYRQTAKPVKTLDQVLNIDSIIVTDKKLYDRTGSLVDSLYHNKEVLILHDSKWEKYLLNRMDMRKQVFHEMLRLSGYNDDNYKLSGVIFKEDISPNRLVKDYRNSENAQAAFVTIGSGKLEYKQYTNCQVASVRIISRNQSSTSSYAQDNFLYTDVLRCDQFSTPQTFINYETTTKAKYATGATLKEDEESMARFQTLKNKAESLIRTGNLALLQVSSKTLYNDYQAVFGIGNMPVYKRPAPEVPAQPSQGTVSINTERTSPPQKAVVAFTCSCENKDMPSGTISLYRTAQFSDGTTGRAIYIGTYRADGYLGGPKCSTVAHECNQSRMTNR